MNNLPSTPPDELRSSVRGIVGEHLRRNRPEHLEIFEDSFDLVFSMLSTTSAGASALYTGPSADSTGDASASVATAVFLALRLLQTVSDSEGDPARALGQREAELRAANPGSSDLLTSLATLVLQNHGFQAAVDPIDRPNSGSMVPAPLLEIRAQRSASDISFNLDSPEHRGEPVGQVHLETSPDRTMLALLRSVQDAAPENRSLLMAGLGEELAKAFLPRRLREILQLYSSGTLMILSNEPWIPWELLRLDRTSQALGLRFAISRWRPGRRPPLLFSLTPLSLVPPSAGRLRHAQSVGEDLRRTLGEDSVHELEPRLGPVVEALQDDGRPAFHFAVHGDTRSAAPEGFGLSLIDDPLKAVVVPQMDHRPFALLNACRAAHAEVGLRGPAGIAEAFVESGAGAVVAPLLAVTDRAAARASLRLYQRLLAGDSLAVAVRKVRHADPDPLGGLSYVAFGSPGARCLDSASDVTHGSSSVAPSPGT
ncbi:MAG: CHAT domain-containing protein [Acidobacteriota bacterium]